MRTDVWQTFRMAGDEPWKYADAPDDDWEPDEEDLDELEDNSWENFVRHQEQWMAVGDALRQARMRLGISKREAARRADLSDGAWRHLESGTKKAYGTLVLPNPRPENLVAAARAVDLDPVVVFQLAGRHVPEELRYTGTSRPRALAGPDGAISLDGLSDGDVELVTRLVDRLRTKP